MNCWDRQRGGGPRLTLLVAAAVLVLSSTTGCDDEISVDIEPSVSDETALQPDAIRALVSPDALSRIYQNRSPGGLNVSEDVQSEDLPTSIVSVGPFSKVLPIDEWAISTDESVWSVDIDIDNPTLTIPVRIRDNAGVRICRFRADAQLLQIDASIEVYKSDQSAGTGDEPTAPELGELVTSIPPQLTIDGLSFQAIEPCSALEDGSGSPTGEVADILESHLTDAIDGSVRDLLEISPVDSLGLLEGTATIRRTSRFSSRRGEVRFNARPTGTSTSPSSDLGVILDPEGLRLDMESGLTSLRAPCFPPDPLPSPGSQPAGDLTPADLSDDETDVAAAFSTSLIQRLVQAGAVGGFYCLGLDQQRTGAERAISRLTASDVQLEDIGLGHLAVSGSVEPVISAGAFPTVTFVPETDSVEAVWSDLTIDLYGRIDGTRVRLLEVTISSELGLRPRIPASGAGRSIPFRLESLTITGVEFESSWRSNSTPPPELKRWSRRLANLILEDAFVLPLPLAPSRSIELTSVAVRPNDLFLGWSIPEATAGSP